VTDQPNPATTRAEEKRHRLNERLRAEFIAGAEEDSRRRFGRGLTAQEHKRVLRLFPGDV
jgi:DNA invertase Pin-like site-specific DNA recombinase